MDDFASFSTLADSFASDVATRQQTSSKRPAQTRSIAELDKVINAAEIEVKVYIQKKFKKAIAVAQYARYGIVHSNKSYNIPRDHDSRLDALLLMQQAITDDGFSIEEYGDTFWAATIQEYGLALKAATSTTSLISSTAATKNVTKKTIRKVIKSVMKLIEANYRLTFILWGASVKVLLGINS